MKHFSLLLCFAVVTTIVAKADDTVFSSNLPLVYINTDTAINADRKVPGTMRVIDQGEGRRNYSTDTVYNYNGRIGIKWRGNSSLSFNQKKYTVETRDSLGQDLKVPILGMPSESDWVLLAPYNDISLLRDVYAFSLWNEMGHWGPRTRMCEVFVNDTYMGVYACSESIKRDKERVDIAKLKTADIEGRNLTGGYIVRVDVTDDDDYSFTSKVNGIQPSMWGGGSAGTVTWNVYYPKKDSLQEAQANYIIDYVNQMEQSFQQSNFADTVEGYAKWIDIPSWVDYFIHTELSLNADGFKRSVYFHKDKDKKNGTVRKMQAGPVWDYNLAFGNCNFCNANNVEAWVYEGCYTNPTPAFWKKLTTDPSFMAKVKARYAQLRHTVLSQEHIDAFFDDYAALLDEAKDRHYEKYSELFSTGQSSGQGTGWGWGWNWGTTTTNPAASYAGYLVSSYEEEIQSVKAWFGKRLAFLDRNWEYDSAASIATTSGQYFDVEATLAGDGLLKVTAPQGLIGVEVYSVSGHLLASRFLADDNQGQYGQKTYGQWKGQSGITIPIPSSGHTTLVVACYGEDDAFATCRIHVRK